MSSSSSFLPVDAVPLSDMTTASTLAITRPSGQTSVAINSTSRVKGLEAAILRSYADVIHPLHEQEGTVNNLGLPWLTHYYKTYVEVFQDCLDHSAELAYGELALFNYLIDTDPLEGFDTQVRSFVQDMSDEIKTFVKKLRALQASSSTLWTGVIVEGDEKDPIQCAIDQVKAHISKFPAEKQKLAEGVEVAIRCQPDFATTVEKVLLHWDDHHKYFISRLRATSAILSSAFIAGDRKQRISTQDYITAIHSTMQDHGVYFAKTNQFVKDLSSRAVSKLRKESVPLPPFCKTQFMETIGAPVLAHAAKQLKHLTKLMEGKVTAELVGVKYLSGGKYRIGVAVDVASDALSQQVIGDVEGRCKSLQVTLRFNHVKHRSDSQLFCPHVLDCEPRTGKLNAEDIKRTLSSRVTGRIPVLTFVEGYRETKEEYTARHGINVINSKKDVEGSGVASGVTWVINEDTFREFKYDGIPGIPVTVDLQTDDSHQVLVTVDIKATFAMRIKILPWVYVQATRFVEANEVDRFVNLTVWSVKECNFETRKEERFLKLNVVEDSLEYTQPS